MAQTHPNQFQVPFAGRVTSIFSSHHPGIDIAADLKTAIRPIDFGTVIQAGKNPNPNLGLTVKLSHNDNYQSLYAHMNMVNVKVGQTVSINDILGTVGLTGNTTGPHTHLEITKDGQYINPATVLPMATFSLSGFSSPGQGGSSQVNTELPRTGLPSISWVGVLLLPLGLLFIKVEKGSKFFTPRYLVLKRQAKRGSSGFF
ncbi:MAG: M23 family metallopeptidase [Patescibacteria group bacterium]|nr:M23 family metallopeptidase [Patescibacteria group bacterium]